MDDKDKKKLGYVPDIQYEEDYYSDKAYRKQAANQIDDDDSDDIYDDAIMDHIQDNIDHLAKIIPLLPIEVQTAVNQVFKPIFNDWYLNLKGHRYPSRIPDPDGVIIKPIVPPGGIFNPDPIDPGGGDDPDPGGGSEPTPGPGNITDPPVFPWDPQGPKPIPGRRPTIFTPDIKDPIIEPTIPGPTDILPVDDDIFAPSSPFTVEYEKVDPIEKIEMEYIRNNADVYLYYTRKLRTTLDKFTFSALTSIITTNNDTGRNDSEKFLFDNLTLGDTEVADNLRHLIDTGLRGEVNGRFKLQFLSNTFSLENTLYHLKEYKVNKDLRLRYEKEEMMADGTKAGSKSDRILSGLRQTYDKKYDTSYINLYKYLNSSVVVLQDAINSLLLAVNAKETLLKKGGSEKE